MRLENQIRVGDWHRLLFLDAVIIMQSLAVCMPTLGL